MAPKVGDLGLDVATLVVHVVGMDFTGPVVLRQRMTRGELRHVLATHPPAPMGMDASGRAHDWARRSREHGDEVGLIAPQLVKAYVNSPKHDTGDAEAICEAVTRPTICFVPIKQQERQDIHALCTGFECGIIRARAARGESNGTPYSMEAGLWSSKRQAHPLRST